MFGALSLPLVDASLYSYASCIGRSQASSSSLRSILLAECRPRRRHLHKQVQPVGSSLLRRSYTSGSDDSQSSSTSSQDTSATTVSSSSSGESPSRPTDGSSSSNSPPTSPATSSTSQPASPIFQFLLSVSFLGKPAHPDDPKSFASTFSSNSPIKRWRDAQLQQHGRGWKGKGKARAPDAGDDFWFLEKRSNGETNYHGITSDSAVFGVADGVGGWAESGVDPGLFSQALMYYAQQSTDSLHKEIAPTGSSQGSLSTTYAVYPHDVLHQAYASVLAEKDVVAGSSTATVICLDGNAGLMRAANLGDSSFAIVRSDKVVHQQPPQQHYFNCPYQLSKLPKEMQGDPRSIVDEASQADLFETKLEDGDIIIAFTDGFGDNVFMREVEVLLTRLRDEKEYNVGDGFEQHYADKIADSLVSYAKLCSEKKDKQSPFELEARRNKMHYKGGKVDDICVAVALVKQVA